MVVLAAVWLPVVRSPPRDSFPLSTYPMFSSLLETVSDVDLVVGVDRSGSEIRLSPQLIAGTDEVIVAGSTVRQAVRAGDTEALCALVADRVARNGPAEVVSVLVKTDTIDAIEWYAGNRQPRDTVVHSACEIAR
ncbi:MAG: hypothetical protein R2770_06140 [Acidimicrobiales bacterium]